MFNRILVPLDGSELAEKALQPAVKLARKIGGELVLLAAASVQQVFVTEMTAYSASQIETEHAHTRDRLTAYLGEMAEQLPSYLPAHCHVIDGDAAGVIVDTAVSEKIDLIVMSTHGRSGVSRWIMGSVTERVLRQAPCPVLVLREDVEFDNILITLDGSELAEYALPVGLTFAKMMEGKVVLMSVQPQDEIDPAFIADLERIEPGLGGITRDDYYHRTESYLERMAKKIKMEFDQEVETEPRDGPPATMILNYIEKQDVDLVVMATHGRTGLSRWRYGSVTEKVLREGKSAFLVVRPPLAELS